MLTGVVGEAIRKVDREDRCLRGRPKAEIELLFGRLDLIAPARLAAGVVILWAGLRERLAGRGRRR